MAIHPAFKIAGERLGWRWSSVHNGLINDSVKRPNHEPQHEGGYIVAVDWEDACSLSHVDTVKQALDTIGTDRAREAGLL